MEFKDIQKAVAETASAAGKKAGDIANKAKIRFALANMQSDLDELYEKLGKLYYQSFATGANNSAKESALISKIESLKTDMEILRAEIGLYPKSSRECPVCGKSVPKNAEFCPFCGKEI